jgi:hypothetical protein
LDLDVSNKIYLGFKLRKKYIQMEETITKYHLQVLSAGIILEEVVEADYFRTVANNQTSSGYYAFHCGEVLVACYPIERTIIKKIER